MSWQVLAAFIASFITCLLVLKAGARFIPLDHPNRRSMHVEPVPRGGGIGVLAGTVAGVLILGNQLPDWGAGLIVIGNLLLVIIAWRDDRKGVPPGYRLMAQATAAGCLLLALLYQTSDSTAPVSAWLLLLLAVVLLPVIVWSINLYNFMDGMDGLAVAMGIIGFGCLAWFGWQAGQMVYASLAMIVVAACAGFLPFNIHPAKMFMGDVGSTLLGFWVAGFSLWGITLELYPWWTPLLVFSPFWVDATMTLLRRAWKKENVFQAHRSHYYQRLVGAGLGQRRTLLLEVVLMMACAVSSAIAINWPQRGQYLLVTGWCVMYGIFLQIVT